ncbi:hypothetical protein Pelo_13386 [Pelomyxa schiedti]|nr:hypothetical protein Pelo_13386 [Pelomyxa schiedti]
MDGSRSRRYVPSPTNEIVGEEGTLVISGDDGGSADYEEAIEDDLQPEHPPPQQYSYEQRRQQYSGGNNRAWSAIAAAGGISTPADNEGVSNTEGIAEGDDELEDVLDSEEEEDDDDGVGNPGADQQGAAGDEGDEGGEGDVEEDEGEQEEDEDDEEEGHVEIVGDDDANEGDQARQGEVSEGEVVEGQEAQASRTGNKDSAMEKDGSAGAPQARGNSTFVPTSGSRGALLPTAARANALAKTSSLMRTWPKPSITSAQPAHVYGRKPGTHEGGGRGIIGGDWMSHLVGSMPAVGSTLTVPASNKNLCAPKISAPAGRGGRDSAAKAEMLSKLAELEAEHQKCVTEINAAHAELRKRQNELDLQTKLFSGRKGRGNGGIGLFSLPAEPNHKGLFRSAAPHHTTHSHMPQWHVERAADAPIRSTATQTSPDQPQPGGRRNVTQGESPLWNKQIKNYTRMHQASQPDEPRFSRNSDVLHQHRVVAAEVVRGKDRHGVEGNSQSNIRDILPHTREYINENKHKKALLEASEQERRLHLELKAQMKEIHSVRERFNNLRSLLAQSEKSIYHVQDAMHSLRSKMNAVNTKQQGLKQSGKQKSSYSQDLQLAIAYAKSLPKNKRRNFYSTFFAQFCEDLFDEESSGESATPEYAPDTRYAPPVQIKPLAPNHRSTSGHANVPSVRNSASKITNPLAPKAVVPKRGNTNRIPPKQAKSSAPRSFDALSSENDAWQSQERLDCAFVASELDQLEAFLCARSCTVQRPSPGRIHTASREKAGFLLPLLKRLRGLDGNQLIATCQGILNALPLPEECSTKPTQADENSIKDSLPPDQGEPITADISKEQMDRIASQYKGEIIENEIIIRKFNLEMLSLMSDSGSAGAESSHIFTPKDCDKMFSVLAQVPTVSEDQSLLSTLKEIVFSAQGQSALDCYQKLLREVSDALYDTLIYNKVIQRVNETCSEEQQQTEPTGLLKLSPSQGHDNESMISDSHSRAATYGSESPPLLSDVSSDPDAHTENTRQTTLSQGEAPDSFLSDEENFLEDPMFAYQRLQDEPEVDLSFFPEFDPKPVPHNVPATIPALTSVPVVTDPALATPQQIPKPVSSHPTVKSASPVSTAPGSVEATQPVPKADSPQSEQTTPQPPVTPDTKKIPSPSITPTAIAIATVAPEPTPVPSSSNTTKEEVPSNIPTTEKDPSPPAPTDATPSQPANQNQNP